MASPEKVGLTALEVANGLGVTKQTVYNWLKNDGLPFVDTPKGKIIALRDLIDWHIKQVRPEPVKPVKFEAPEQEIVPAENYEAALARKTRAEADLKELQLAERRGQVAAIIDVEKVLAASTVAIRTQVEALPSLLSTQLVMIPDQNAVHRVVAAETQQLLTNLATIDAIKEAARIAEVEE